MTYNSGPQTKGNTGLINRGVKGSLITHTHTPGTNEDTKRGQTPEDGQKREGNTRQRDTRLTVI